MEKILKVGSLSFFPVVLAPMAGITDRVFRGLARSMGAGLVFSEMVSVKGLIYDQEKTRRLLAFHEKDRPIGIQLFGSSPSEMAKAAHIIEESYQPDLLDINMGCPVKKVVKAGAGAALMQDPEQAIKIVKAVKAAVQIPVSVKIRAGWDQENINAPYFASLLEEAGVSLITVHGRTRKDFYKGKADWNLIEEVKKSLVIPVIGNGDIFSLEDFLLVCRESTVDGVMIGRGSLGNPWLFQDISSYSLTQELRRRPTPEERIHMVLSHLQELVKEKGETRGVLEMRKHSGYYLKGLPQIKERKVALNQAKTLKEMEDLLKDYRRLLHRG